MIFLILFISGLCLRRILQETCLSRWNWRILPLKRFTGPDSNCMRVVTGDFPTSEKKKISFEKMPLPAQLKGHWAKVRKVGGSECTFGEIPFIASARQSDLREISPAGTRKYIPELCRVGESLHLVREFRIRSPPPLPLLSDGDSHSSHRRIKKRWNSFQKSIFFSWSGVFFPFPPPLGPFVGNPRSYTRSVSKKYLHSPPPSALALTACFVFFGLWIYACDLLFCLFFCGKSSSSTRVHFLLPFFCLCLLSRTIFDLRGLREGGPPPLKHKNAIAF